MQIPSPAPQYLLPSAEDQLFPECSVELRELIWSRGVVREYGPGASIVAPGDSGSMIRFLVSGRANVVFHETDGADISVETIYPGDVIGEVSYLTGRPAPLNSEVISRDPSQVFELPSEQFEEILKFHPEFSVSILRNMARKVIRLDQSVYKNTRKKRALQNLISQQDHLFPDYFVSETVRRRVGRKLDELANSPWPVLITGETGVGKEFMAHAMYKMCSHHKRVFLFLDLLRPLTETDHASDYCELPDHAPDPTEHQMKLFLGYEKKSESGVRVETPGYLELTEEGTLLVRGIEQLTPVMQKHLLHTLKTTKFRKLGAYTFQNCDTRLIGTTNLDASEISAEKHPLLHWLMKHSIDVPPLRKRRKEIPALVQYYVNKYCQELHKDVTKLPKETIKTLVSYSWPGNDRELATTLKRAVILAEDGVLRPQDIYFDLRRIEGDGKINLMRLPSVRGALKSPLFPAIFQSAAVPFFFILLVMLFLGPADPVKNVGGLFSWAVGWPTMIFGAFFWARFWCSLCPMGSVGHLAKKVISLDLPFPSFLKQKSDWIIFVSAIFIIWLETATDIRNSPFNTGLLLLTIFVLAVAFSVIFERQSWCRYLCPLGGMMGVFAKVSAFELRADRNVCASQCVSNECFVGTRDREGCPFGQMVPSLRSNRFCKMCGNCVKNCPHGAINLNLRVPGREIWEMKQVGAVTAFLVISMFGGLMSDLLKNSSLYDMFSQNLINTPELVVFTIFFTLVIVSANSLLGVSAYISSRISGETMTDNFAKYGLAMLPLVMTGFMAFHLYYLINLGVYFPIVLWQTFHFEIFQKMVITVPLDWTLFLQRLLIGLGLAGTGVMIYRLGHGRGITFSQNLFEFLPHFTVAILFAIGLAKAIHLFFY